MEVIDDLCVDGWAYIDVCPGCGGDTEQVVRLVDDTWTVVLVFPIGPDQPRCRAEWEDQGMPAAILDRVGFPCTDAPPAPTTAAGSATVVAEDIDLSGAPVPSLCEQPAGTLVDGELPNPVNNGFVMLRQELTVIGDVMGDAAPEAVGVIACSAGGVGWPNTVEIYGPGPELLLEIKLTDHYNPDALTALVESVEIVDRTLVVRWATDAPGDPIAEPSINVEGRFTIEGTEVTAVVTELADSTTTAQPQTAPPADGDVCGILDQINTQTDAFFDFDATYSEEEGFAMLQDLAQLWEDLGAALPADLAADAQVIADAWRELADRGTAEDPNTLEEVFGLYEEIFSAPDFVAAGERVYAYLVDACPGHLSTEAGG